MKIKPIAFEDIKIGDVVLIKSSEITGAVWMTEVNKIKGDCIFGAKGAWYKETDKFFIVTPEDGYITFGSVSNIDVV